ncbi:MAG: carbohydrate kinase [Lachnospiraceae bacterium]|nr:carbohydrate kinase [Lachnospiraceae bacterium]
MDLICIGEMLIDFTPGSAPDEFTANPGGAPANVAITAARSGIDTGFIGKLGNDAFGKRLLKVLETDNVKMLCDSLTDDAITTLAFVSLGQDGERSFTFARKPGADILLRPEDVDMEAISECRILHAGSLSLSDEPSRSAVMAAIKEAKSKNKIISFDVNYRDMIWRSEERCKEQTDPVLPYVDILKISDQELSFVGGSDNIESFMINNRTTVLIVTMGKDGARYYFRKSAGSISSDVVPGRNVPSIDTTAAGDAFFGAFLSRLLLFGITQAGGITEDMVKCAVKYGNAAGSLCIQSWGGIPSLPERSHIESVLDKE